MKGAHSPHSANKTQPTEGAPNMHNSDYQKSANRQYTAREVMDMKRGKNSRSHSLGGKRRKTVNISDTANTFVSNDVGSASECA